MTETGAYRWRMTVTLMSFVLASMFVSAERNVMSDDVTVVAGYGDVEETETVYFVKLVKSLFRTDGSGYHHVWPVSFCLFVI